MYIKKITISNFKSYGGKCVLEGISRNITAFVGSVGSGKSNFLEAIKFVSEFGYIELKDKMRLLNSNSRERVLAVELEFGDCDLFNGKEISFKRKVKENRDMFYINQQMVSRKDFMAVLEVCAFCTKSLYFASPRTINDFVMTSAHGRLLSFIDCLGTSISLSLASINKTALKMEELKVKYEKLDDFLANMAAYNYDEELEKLQKYKELQAKKSYLILLLHNHYIRNWQQKIKQLEDMRGTEQTKKFYDSQVERNKLKIRLQDVHRSILNGGYLKEDMEKEMISLLVKKEKISLALKEADQNIEYAKKSVQDETKVNELIEEISSLEQKINALEVKYSEKNQELVDLTESLSMAEQTRLELLTNIRRFQSKADRNRWINEQLRLIECKVVANETGKSELLAQRAQLCRKRVDLERELQEHDTESESEQRCELKKKHYETVIHIKELRRNQNEIEENVKMLEETLDGKKVELRFKQGHGTYNGGESIQKVLNKWKNSGNEYYLNLLRGYHGMVIDNFVCSQQINIAVESAVGKMLYMHIIDDNTVGNGLLKEMKEMQLPGEVVFLPLNRIVPKQIHRRADDENSFSLISKLDYEEKFDKVMQFIFSNVLLCKNLETAVKLAKSYGFTCVTFDGDKVRKNGVMSGGYVDHAKCTMSLYLNIKKLEIQLGSLNSKLDSLRETLNVTENKASHLNSLLQKYKLKNIIAEQSFESKMNAKLAELDREIDLLNKRIENIELDNRKLKIKQTAMNNNLTEEFHSKLNPDEIKLKLLNYNKYIDENEKKINKLKDSLLKINYEKEKLENLLNSKRQFNTLMKTDDKELRKYRGQKNDLIVQQQILERRFDVVQKQLIEQEKKINEAKHQESVLSKQLSDIENELQSGIHQPLSYSQVYEKIRFYEEKINESVMLIRSIEAHSYQGLDVTLYDHFTRVQLINEIKSIRAQIQNIGKINIRAQEEMKQEIELRQKFDNVYSLFIESSILMMEFANWLGQNIEYMINLISTKFTYYFNRLVPDGSACLSLQHLDGNNTASEDLVDFGKKFGLSISVKFSGGHEPQDNMNFLSKGQQCLLLLAFIFAFLSTYQYPFCILDEIERHLSINEIGRLIEVLKEIDNVQFFISSHNIDIVNTSDDIFHVTFQSLQTLLRKIDHDEVADIIGTLRQQSQDSEITLSSSASTI